MFHHNEPKRPLTPPSSHWLLTLAAPEDLEGFLAADPPDAILTGSESETTGFTKADIGGLEKPIELYAQEHGFIPIPVPIDHFDHSSLGSELVLWVR